jgi:glutamate 5-kinase
MHKRIVVKLGTSVLTNGGPRLDRAGMVEVARQCARLHAEGRDVIVVTSGAIAAGREMLGHPPLPATVATKQMLAAVGQSRLMRVWEGLFEIYGLVVGQVLLTRADFDDRHRFLNARDALQALLEHRIVPVINENDAIVTSEIKVGDNDNLSAMVAVLAEADLLLLLTDLDGLYTADPRTHPDAQLISEVRAIDTTLEAVAGDSVSGLGTGGMMTKLQAADIARRAGIDVIIAAGRAPDVILRATAGEPIGTRFPPLDSPTENRKRWIFGKARPRGKLVVDAGAAVALREKGGSLLPAGIKKVEGAFERGESVLIVDPADVPLARGIARYDSADMRRIAGCHSTDIAERLGYEAGPVAVHRNDMLLLQG